MGSSVSTLYNSLWGTKEFFILMVSTDGSQGSDIFNPTTGFTVEPIKYKDVSFRILEMCGGDKIRPLWRHYDFCQGIIFILDSTYRNGIGEVRDEILKLMNYNGFSNTSLLIYAIKQELPDAMDIEEINEKLNLHSLKQDWHIQPFCATSNDGIYEGLEWLSQKLKQNESKLNNTTS